MSARVARKLDPLRVLCRVVLHGKTIGYINRLRDIEHWQSKDWTCSVVRNGRIVAVGFAFRRGDGKRWILQTYLKVQNELA